MSSSLSKYRILVDKVRAGYDQEDAVGRTPISESTFNLLGRWFRVLADRQVRIEIGPYMFLALIPVKKPGDKGKHRETSEKGDAKGILTQCFLAWLGPDWTDGERRIFLSLICSGGRFYLNQDFNPAKLLTGQNAFGPHPAGTWMGKPILHTPAGYVQLGYNLLGYFMSQAVREVSGGREKFNLRTVVDPATTMWSRMDLVDLVDIGSTDKRDKLLRVLSSITRLNVAVTRDQEYRELNLRYLFGLEALPVVGDRKTRAPTLSLKRWLPCSARNGKNGSVAYTLNLYAKDVEMIETGREETLARYPAAYQRALAEGIRVEIQLTPEAFRIPEVRQFCVERGWLPASEGRFNNVQSTLHTLFPTYDDYLERSCELARFLWRDSCIFLVVTPPDPADIVAWAKEHGVLMHRIVRLWLGDLESPRDVALERAQVLHASHKDWGSRREFESAYSAFEERWKFKLNRVPPATFYLLLKQQSYALSDDDIQIRIASVHGRLMTNAMKMQEARDEDDAGALERLEAERQELLEKSNNLLNNTTTDWVKRLREFHTLFKRLRPNTYESLTINTKEPA